MGKYDVKRPLGRIKPGSNESTYTMKVPAQAKQSVLPEAGKAADREPSWEIISPVVSTRWIFDLIPGCESC
jgi:hypothetical protein